MDQLIIFSLSDLVNNTIGYLLSLWWIYIPLILLILLIMLFESYSRTNYINSLKWFLLEIQVPQDPHKSPKAAEQIYAALHAIQPKVKAKEKFWLGKVPDWFSFEIVSISGQIHIFVRTLEAHRNFVESQIYAQYPDAEIKEADDYMNDLPLILPDDQYDLNGGDFILEKEDAYPIRTYPDFEEERPGKDDVKRIDPMASLVESMSTLLSGERIAVQVLVRSTDDKWVKDAQQAIDKLMGKKPKSKKTVTTTIVGSIMTNVLRYGPPEKKDEKEVTMSQLTPGTQEALKAIEKSLAKLGLETNIRFLYIAPKDIYNKGKIAAVTGCFKQFSSFALNSFKINKETAPGGKWPFKPMTEFGRKKKLYRKFRLRQYAKKRYVLNTEELATVFHFPDIGVKSAVLPRIEARKGEAPAELPI